MRFQSILVTRSIVYLFVFFFAADDLSLRVSDVTGGSGERRVTVVRLRKDDDVGIGLSIVGGENSGTSYEDGVQCPVTTSKSLLSACVQFNRSFSTRLCCRETRSWSVCEGGDERRSSRPQWTGARRRSNHRNQRSKFGGTDQWASSGPHSQVTWHCRTLPLAASDVTRRQRVVAQRKWAERKWQQQCSDSGTRKSQPITARHAESDVWSFTVSRLNLVCEGSLPQTHTKQETITITTKCELKQ